MAKGREWQCGYCGKWVSHQSPRHAHFEPDGNGGWTRVAYERKPGDRWRDMQPVI